MIEFNDRRKDQTIDWRISQVRRINAQKRADAIYEPRYPGQYIPTPQEVAKADKAKAKRMSKVKKSQ